MSNRMKARVIKDLHHSWYLNVLSILNCIRIHAITYTYCIRCDGQRTTHWSEDFMNWKKKKKKNLINSSPVWKGPVISRIKRTTPIFRTTDYFELLLSCFNLLRNIKTLGK